MLSVIKGYEGFVHEFCVTSLCPGGRGGYFRYGCSPSSILLHIFMYSFSSPIGCVLIESIHLMDIMTICHRDNKRMQ
ncbi:hypothetical protein BDV38DRAFT_262576 [Aspergillus pseudotamarii]|uniref:Uncharacterized protein n=1 Tax=Aspergillus pseudotamarii TaxID=132259 RepID=A0A5N6SDS7_ASPPS|nr:uncharacterized protein BDV38DRAFT_262576 [Aspergillus pseudotamarii]KAE8132009.1 hypothetical protein BDV38DRAFT_262576 [Aspergillus pseudotamarii]